MNLSLWSAIWGLCYQAIEAAAAHLQKELESKLCEMGAHAHSSEICRLELEDRVRHMHGHIQMQDQQLREVSVEIGLLLISHTVCT